MIRERAADLPSVPTENTILSMQNKILRPKTSEPEAISSPGRPAETSLAGRAVDRSLERRRLAAQDEVERLIQAAFRVIEASGELEPKVSDILAEAGLSNQAFYRHFKSKRALLVAVLDEGIRGLGSYLRARMDAAAPATADISHTSEAAGLDPEPAIRQWIRGMAAQAMDPSGAEASRPFALARGRLAESFPAEVAESEKQVTAPLREVLERAQRAGRLPDVEPDADAENLYHLMMGWVEARLVEGRIPAEREVARLESFVMAGLIGGKI